MRVFLVVFCFISSALAFDHVLNAKCENWVTSNRRQMMMLNQVATVNNINSCQQYCEVAGGGFRPETTMCRSLCESIGLPKFIQILSMDKGFSLPEQTCKAILENAHREIKPTRPDVNILPASSFVELSTEQTTVPKRIGVKGDVSVQGTVSASVVTSPVGNIKVSGQMNVMNQIDSASLTTASLASTAGISVRQGIVSKKDQLAIYGKIDASTVSAQSIRTNSFLEINSVRQWSLHSLEDFDETDGVNGWSHGEITECAGRKILGGHCVKTESANGEVSKTFTNLPPHSQIRINAKYNFIDSWDGESGYLKIDNSIVWTETYNHADGDIKHGLNLCGNETPERKFGRSVDVTVPHSSNSITLVFGATTDEHPCDESFGIDSVMVFVR